MPPPPGKPALTHLLILLVGVALLAFLLSPLPQLTPAARLHLVFAVGVVPLILASITWFTPVLTRSGPPEGTTLGPPLLGLAGGLLLVHALGRQMTLFPLAALLDLTALAWLAWWIRRRARSALGGPHPGLLWYRLALAALALGLAAILAGWLWPAQWLPLRRLHLHLNLLGFIGLTTIGTWRVLLPTAAGFGDPAAAGWLRRRWLPLAGGTLAVAVGAAWWPPLSLAGLLLWLASLTPLLRHPLLTHRDRVLTPHGAAPALAGALAGLVILLAASTGHALGWSDPAAAATAFVQLFLLPLVTGATSHLLPLWRHPADGDRRRALGRRLGYGSGVRALLFLAAGCATLAGAGWGWPLALVALGQFLVAAVPFRSGTR